jgi:phosphonate transport system substrate-binding protein
MLTCASYLAPNWYWFYQAIAHAIQRAVQQQIQLIQCPVDPLDDPPFLKGEFDLVLLCGLPFIRHYQRHPHLYQPLVAPVMQDQRYGDRPIYFADVIVHSQSSLNTLADLAGRSFCYNDPGSNSGYHLVRAFVQQQGYDAAFWGEKTQSGSHQTSIRWVVEGLADWAAIDSTVLERTQQTQPTLNQQIRTIATIGPCPIPPLVAAQHLGVEQWTIMQTALFNPDIALQQAMQQAGVKRFTAIDIDPYLEIAHLYNVSQLTRWD